MVVGRLIGWVILLAAIAVEGRDLLGWYDTGRYHAVALGELWFQLDRDSLLLAQPAIQRYLAPWLWDPFLTSVLLFPAALTTAVLGCLLIGLFRRRDRKRRR